MKPATCGGEPLQAGNVCCAGGVQGPACCERPGDPTCCGVVTLAPANVCCGDGSQGTTCCGPTALATGNTCCDDGHQGSACCGPAGATVVLSSGNECCADGTQGPVGSGISAACCGGTVRKPTYKCCLDGTQGLYCGADAWAGTWTGPLESGCTSPVTAGLTYHIYVVSETSLLVDYAFPSGTGSYTATVDGNSATSGYVTLTLDPSVTPPTITVVETSVCQHGVLTLQSR